MTLLHKKKYEHFDGNLAQLNKMVLHITKHHIYGVPLLYLSLIKPIILKGSLK